MQFLMKLNEHYAVVRGNILMMNPLPNLSQAYRLLIQEERHRELSNLHNSNQGNYDSMVFASTRRFQDRLQNKGLVIQLSIVGSYMAIQMISRRMCSRKGEELQQLLNQLSQANLAGKICLTTSLNAGWLVDSGATDHICTNLNMFPTFKELHGINNSITIPDGSKINVLHIGSVILNGDNVLHVPDFKFNLLSVPKLCKDMNCKVLFTHDVCFVQDHSQSSILLGRLHAGLYYVEDQKCSASLSLSSNFLTSCNYTSWTQASKNATKIAELWHLRLEHLPFHNFKHVLPWHIKDCTDSILCKVHRSKFDARASPWVFIGYALPQKGYNVLDLSTYKIHITRDIVFHEHHLPFHFKSSNTTSPVLFLPKYTTSHIEIPESSHLFPPAIEILHPNNHQSSLVTSHTDTSSIPVYVPVDIPTSQVPPIRQSTRPSKEPSSMKDYKCYSSINHWCNLISFNSLPAKSKTIISSAAQMVEPVSYLEASQDTNWV
uniref:Uncharacterized protein n=1 Tax=Chenopodium quinoa TaxID=63459 RepID=A0A803KQU1_CHEQI